MRRTTVSLAAAYRIPEARGQMLYTTSWSARRAGVWAPPATTGSLRASRRPAGRRPAPAGPGRAPTARPAWPIWSPAHDHHPPRPHRPQPDRPRRAVRRGGMDHRDVGYADAIGPSRMIARARSARAASAVTPTSHQVAPAATYGAGSPPGSRQPRGRRAVDRSCRRFGPARSDRRRSRQVGRGAPGRPGRTPGSGLPGAAAGRSRSPRRPRRARPAAAPAAAETASRRPWSAPRGGAPAHPTRPRSGSAGTHRACGPAAGRRAPRR
jgi:hypothetical protein